MLREEPILNYQITTKSKDECISEVLHWIDENERNRYFVCANPHSLEIARTDKLFDESFKNANLVVPDGIGIVIASKILGGGIQGRITGNDIFSGLNEVLNKKGKYTCFLLGSTKNTLIKIKNNMKKDFPNIKVVGLYSPPFKQEFSIEDNRLMIEAINEAKPDVLWIGMTAPKQENWAFKYKDRLDVKFIGPIGAVFDFYSGNVKRSHSFFQKIGLEWLPRFLQEPRRLWQRNLISAPTFLLRVLSEKRKR